MILYLLVQKDSKYYLQVEITNST